MKNGDEKDELNKQFPNRVETKREVVERRNEYLAHFFHKVQMDINIIGNPQHPIIIIEGCYRLSAFVHNFNIHFLSEIKNGVVLRIYKLKKGAFISDRDFCELLKQMKNKRLYRVRFANKELFLAGYNHMKIAGISHKYPVFAKHRYKVYFNKDRIYEIIKEFHNYPLILD